MKHQDNLNPREPATSSNTVWNTDGDGLGLFDEYRHCTDPGETDTDNDGVSDLDELTPRAVGGPGLLAASGQDDPFSCSGDASGSHSECWNLEVAECGGPYLSVVRYCDDGFGTPGSAEYALVKGKTYTFRLRWVATDPDYEYYPQPDYDWQCWINESAAAGAQPALYSTGAIIVEDPDSLLTDYTDGGDENFTLSREGKIYVPKVVFKESEPCSGFDPTLSPPWLMVPEDAANTVVAEITPAAADWITFEVANTGKASVSPSAAASSEQTLTLSGVSAGETELRAKTAGTDTVLAALGLWGRQANVWFTITRSDYTVNYDLDRSGTLAHPNKGTAPNPMEAVAISADAKDISVNYNIYYVSMLDYSIGTTSGFSGETWTGANDVNSPLNHTAHEVGHLLKIEYESDDVLDLMYHTGHESNPCRILKRDWDEVNK